MKRESLSKLLQSFRELVARILLRIPGCSFPNFLGKIFRLRKVTLTADVALLSENFRFDSFGKRRISAGNRGGSCIPMRIEEGLREWMSVQLLDVTLRPTRRGGIVLAGNRMVVPSFRPGASPKVFFPQTSVGMIFGQSSSEAVIGQCRTEFLDRGIFVGSLAPYNWFHWQIDYLPTAWRTRSLPEEYDNYPLLVPTAGLRNRNFRDALDGLELGRDFLEIDSSVEYSLNSLVWMKSFTSSAERVHPADEYPRISIDVDGIDAYRNFQLERRPPAREGLFSQRIFIERSHEAERSYNEEQIWSIARNYGFSRLRLEGLSLDKSIEIFRNAEFIVGPHGAGWSEFLYASTNAVGILFTWEDSRGDNWYENIGHVSDGLLRIIFFERNRQVGKEPRTASHYLDPGVFENELKMLGLAN